MMYIIIVHRLITDVNTILKLSDYLESNNLADFDKNFLGQL